MADGEEGAAAQISSSSAEHTQEYHQLMELGLDSRVAGKLEEIYQTGTIHHILYLQLSKYILMLALIFLLVCVINVSGKLVHNELDVRALDALKDFPVEGAQSVLQQFLESNLEHVSNKSAFLCGIMKIYRYVVQYSAAAVYLNLLCL